MELGIFVAAVAIDAVWGEWPARIHPVVWMGAWIAMWTSWLPRTGWQAGVAGAFLVMLVLGLVGGPTIYLLHFESLGPVLYGAAGVFLLSSSFAVRLLITELAGLQQALGQPGLEPGRRYLGRLCSRDATRLEEPDVVGAGISSGAENTVDSIVAPWMYWALFGIPGALIYRAINTLDAMVGYRGEYERLGKAAAKLDDVANWVPARLTAGLMLLAGAVLRMPVTEGLQVAWRDHRRTPSPNGGWPMAATAGLLGMQLRKPGAYVLNDAGTPPSSEGLGATNRLILTTTVLAAGACLALRVHLHG